MQGMKKYLKLFGLAPKFRRTDYVELKMSLYFHTVLYSMGFLLAAGSQAYGQDNCQTECPCPCPPRFEQGLGLCPNSYPAAYNAPARIDVEDCMDIDLYGSFLYWHVSQEWMDLGCESVISTGLPFEPVIQPFDYKPGFKVGFGFNIGSDDWNFFSEYTRLHQQTTFSETLPAGFYWNPTNWIFPTLSDTYFPSTMNSKWKMHFDLVDVGFSRPYYQGKQLTVAPYGAVRGLLITQYMLLETNPNQLNRATATTRSRCWAVGPNAGLASHWLIGSGFRLEGMASGSLLFTRYTKLSQHSFSAALATDPDGGGTDTTIIGSMTDYDVLRPALELGIGFGWGSYFGCGKWYMDLSARYDFLNFWNQNMIRGFDFLITTVGLSAESLQMHGLTATARFDF